MATSPYPFAAAPDIVRSHQKDAYFTGHLSTTLTDLHLRLFGARSAHSHAPELRTLAALAYFCLTTLPGNRTLGEEYCDLVQIDGSSSPSVAGSLPTLRTRAAYIAGTILLPYLVGRSLPSLRSKIRALLERRLAHLRRRGQSASREARLWTYLSTHLASMTSASAGAPLQALTLALFYCTGTYYELAKRLLSLRYVFTRSVPDSPDRAGYELLGVLLAVQIAVQGYLHVREALRSTLSTPGLTGDDSRDATTAFDVAATTHTPLRGLPRFHLEDDKTMAYIKGSQQRRCTLCLEDMKDPAATQCGHVFCWECIGDWVREKPECPLCRREAMVQHILPLRVI